MPTNFIGRLLLKTLLVYIPCVHEGKIFCIVCQIVCFSNCEDEYLGPLTKVSLLLLFKIYLLLFPARGRLTDEMSIT